MFLPICILLMFACDLSLGRLIYQKHEVFDPTYVEPESHGYHGSYEVSPVDDYHEDYSYEEPVVEHYNEYHAPSYGESYDHHVVYGYGESHDPGLIKAYENLHGPLDLPEDYHESYHSYHDYDHAPSYGVKEGSHDDYGSAVEQLLKGVDSHQPILITIKKLVLGK